MCYIDYFESSTDDAPLCAKGLFLNKKFEELNRYCNFKCEPLHKKILITKIDTDIYILTNPQDKLIMERENGRKREKKQVKINNDWPGALKVQILCGAKLIRVEEETGVEEVIIPEEFPCAKFETENLEYNRLIPKQWTKVDDAMTLKTENIGNVMFASLKACLNEDWK